MMSLRVSPGSWRLPAIMVSSEGSGSSTGYESLSSPGLPLLLNLSQNARRLAMVRSTGPVCDSSEFGEERPDDDSEWVEFWRSAKKSSCCVGNGVITLISSPSANLTARVEAWGCVEESMWLTSSSVGGRSEGRELRPLRDSREFTATVARSSLRGMAWRVLMA